MTHARVRKICWSIIGLLACADVVVCFWKGEQIALLILNARAGCFPWSPKEVEYHQGMTLCPGQTAHAQLWIKLPKCILTINGAICVRPEHDRGI